LLHALLYSFAAIAYERFHGMKLFTRNVEQEVSNVHPANE